MLKLLINSTRSDPYHRHFQSTQNTNPTKNRVKRKEINKNALNPQKANMTMETAPSNQ